MIPGMFFFRSLAPFSEVYASLSLAVLTTRATPASDDRCVQVYARYRWDVNAEFSSIEGALAAQVLPTFGLVIQYRQTHMGS